MIRKLILATLIMTPVLATANTSQLPSAPYLPLELATRAAQTALHTCAAQGHAVSVAVVTRDGATKVLLKADNSGPHTTDSAQGKAFTSAAMGRDTAGLAEFIAAKPANAGLRDMDARMVIQAGGLPVKMGGALLAGIGVGGAPSGDIDAACAAAGLKEIGAE